MLKALSVKNIKDIQGEKPTVSIYSTGWFLDALASLDFKLSLSESLMFFWISEDVWNKNSSILVWFYVFVFLLIWNIKAFQTYNFTFIARTWTFIWKMTWEAKFGEILGLVF